MAIVVEENRPKINFLSLLIWVVLIAVIAFAAYYFFFKEPEVIDVVIPADKNFENIDSLSKIQLDPEIIRNPDFESLTSYTTPPKEGRAGRENPFSPF